MRLSIIIPVYNVEKYILMCLRSVLENNLREEDFEIIVVDDESPDGSIAIVREVTAGFPNIRIISQQNTGISGARNTGIRHAQGRFIMFIDSDDWIKPDSLLNLGRLCEDSELDILEFGIEKRYNDGSVGGTFSASTNGNVLNGTDYYKQIRYVNSVFNKIYRREFVEHHQLFFAEKIYVEDFELNTRAFLAAKRVMAIPDLVYQYRQSDNSITRTTDTGKKKKMIDDHVVVLQKTDALYREETDSEKKAFLGERMSFLVVSIFYLMLKNQYSFDEMKEMRKELTRQGIYHIDFPVHQKNKNVFRKILLKNFTLLSLLRNLSRKRTT